MSSQSLQPNLSKPLPRPLSDLLRSHTQDQDREAIDYAFPKAVPAGKMELWGGK